MLWLILLVTTSPGNNLRGGGRAGLKTGPYNESAGNGLEALPNRDIDLQASPDRIIEAVLNNDISDTTRATIAKASTAQQMTALTLGSPEFQRR